MHPLYSVRVPKVKDIPEGVHPTSHFRVRRIGDAQSRSVKCRDNDAAAINALTIPETSAARNTTA